MPDVGTWTEAYCIVVISSVALLIAIGFKSFLRERAEERYRRNLFYQVAFILFIVETTGFFGLLVSALFSAGEPAATPSAPVRFIADLGAIAMVFILPFLTFLYPFTVYIPMVSFIWLVSIVYARLRSIKTPSYSCSLILNFFPALVAFLATRSWLSLIFFGCVTLLGKTFLDD